MKEKIKAIRMICGMLPKGGKNTAAQRRIPFHPTDRGRR